jgi:hypothetical protein
MRITFGKRAGHKRPILANGKAVGYVIEHRNSDGFSYRLTGDPKQHRVKSEKLVIDHVSRKLSQ